ncbi:fungal specific transcription factor domain protein [Rhizoctonia solani AG-3 Rhs1AP]|uniref:Fungal specific transcription factor domain protein n=1 Tax=Rhizoctonia solani AG-3 Rhs1AP TaxID=1086054 RepID=X8IVF9_9AGAM|nr:fungal specific transcription factor domain protein [Rhizoctonia solani AG-3 Rhs1AP]
MSYNQLGSGGDQPMLEEDVPHKIRRVTKACDLCQHAHYVRTQEWPAFLHVLQGQARELETQIIELEGIIRLIAPGIDIEQELDESANSDSPGGSSTLLRPSDSAFLHASDAFVRPSTDSASAFFHPSSAMFNYQPHEEETKPDLSTLSSSSVPLSPIRSTPGSATMYSPPGANVEHSAPSLGSNNPYGIVTSPGATTAPYGSGPSKDPRGVGPEGRPTTSRSPYHTELSFTEGSEISIGLELAHAWKKEVQPQAARRNSRQMNPAEYQGSYTKPMRDKLATRVAPQDLWFPPDDLLASLVDLYFSRFNVILPLLHRPTFESQLAQKLHWRDPSFAAVVLLVCANGSRFSDDTRVMPYYAEDIPLEMREFDAGILFYRECIYVLGIVQTAMVAIENELGACCDIIITYFGTGQVDVCSMGVFPVDILFEHQIMALGAMYLTIGNPSAVLVTTGVSLRLGMQRGIHRNAWQGEANTHNKTLNDEMWRRVFWCSYVLDTLFSTFYGRPTSVLTDQYDLPPPVPMEGEDYLAVTGFRHFTKLCEILTEITRTMYATGRRYDPKRQKLMSMPDNEKKLHEWYRSLPPQLRWTPESGYSCSTGLLEVATWLNSYIISPKYWYDVRMRWFQALERLESRCSRTVERLACTRLGPTPLCWAITLASIINHSHGWYQQHEKRLSRL